MVCKICNKDILLRGVPSHLTRVHKINTKQYYDIFLKNTTEGVCKECGKKLIIYQLQKDIDNSVALNVVTIILTQ